MVRARCKDYSDHHENSGSSNTITQNDDGKINVRENQIGKHEWTIQRQHKYWAVLCMLN